MWPITSKEHVPSFATPYSQLSRSRCSLRRSCLEVTCWVYRTVPLEQLDNMVSLDRKSGLCVPALRAGSVSNCHHVCSSVPLGLCEPNALLPVLPTSTAIVIIVFVPRFLQSDEPEVVHHGACHCGNVEFEVSASPHLVAWNCNCSICNLKRNVHFMVPKAKLRLLKGADSLTGGCRS